MVTRQVSIPTLMEREWYKNKATTDRSWRPLCPSTVCINNRKHMIKEKLGFECLRCGHKVFNDMMPQVTERRKNTRERDAA